VKLRVLQVLFGIAAFLMFFRFGGPALIFGTSGPGPFGNPWVTQTGAATLLLDADLRFFGAMMIGIGVIFLWAIAKPQASRPVITILAGAVLVGAAVRICARITLGDPGTAGTIPVVIEVVLPILLFALLPFVSKDRRE
jgi:uncharacterized protein YjeT (DUF2065 family)